MKKKPKKRTPVLGIAARVKEKNNNYPQIRGVTVGVGLLTKKTVETQNGTHFSGKGVIMKYNGCVQQMTTRLGRTG